MSNYINVSFDLLLNPRVHAFASTMNMSRYEVIGRMLEIEAANASISGDNLMAKEIDIMMKRDGFAAALVEARLAAARSGGRIETLYDMFLEEDNG